MLTLIGSLPAADLKLNVTDKEPPQDLDASFRSLLAPRVIQLLDGDQPVYEFWFCSSIPLKSKPDSVANGMKSIAETTFVGALALGKTLRDYREDEMVKGTYTVRFSLQPQDGDHLGTADFPYFAVLTPAKLDKNLSYLSTYRRLVKTSGKETPTGHPSILSLRPVSADEGEYPRITEPAPDHKCVRLKLAAKVQDESDPVNLIVDLVFVGSAVH